MGNKSFKPIFDIPPKYSKELKDIFLHHIVLFLNINDFHSVLQDINNPWYEKNWMNHSTYIVQESFYSMSYLLNGRYHRTNGPAIKDNSGYEGYYLYGKEIDRRSFIQMK